jgi:hypothetical protein
MKKTNSNSSYHDKYILPAESPYFTKSIYDELNELFQKIHNGDQNFIADSKVKCHADVSYELPLASILSDDYPTIHSMVNDKSFLELFNNTYILFLFTDPEFQRDSRTSSGKKDTFFPHIDMGGVDIKPKANLVFPLLNCNEKTQTSWHKIRYQEEELLKTNMAHVLFDKLDTGIIHSTSLRTNQTVLFNSSEFHSVQNNSGFLRVVAAWPSKETASWDSLINLLVKD